MPPTKLFVFTAIPPSPPRYYTVIVKGGKETFCTVLPVTVVCQRNNRGSWHQVVKNKLFFCMIALMGSIVSMKVLQNGSYSSGQKLHIVIEFVPLISTKNSCY